MNYDNIQLYHRLHAHKQYSTIFETVNYQLKLYYSYRIARE